MPRYDACALLAFSGSHGDGFGVAEDAVFCGGEEFGFELADGLGDSVDGVADFLTT